jgi:2,4-dienoyl-CoA reductase (NADPH2)
MPLQQAGKTIHLIGGAHTASELDAKRAIDQAARLAAVI